MSEPDQHEPRRVASFAPADPTDHRKLGEWQSRYEAPEARKGIRFEAWYLAALLALVPIGMLTLWLDYPKYWLHVSDQKYDPFQRYGLAWLAGVLGGTLFDVKWLYHSVARQVWHLDRRLWRMFTPHISGGLAFSTIALIGSGMFRIFDHQATASRSLIVGVGFLVGYFSDSAIAKLTEIAETLFGASRATKGTEHHSTKKTAGSEPVQ